LEFICYETQGTFDARLLPNQLTNLTLSEISLTTRLILPLEVHTLPDLRILTLNSVPVEGRIQQYLKFPKLKSLKLSSVSFLLPEGDGSSVYNSQRTAEILSEAAFFQGIPNLESLSFGDLPMNSALCTVLQGVLSLQYLSIDHCSIEDFITPFTESLADRRVFSALKSLHIDNSWPIQSDTPYTKFARHCLHHRPNMEVAGNGNCYTYVNFL
jgi:hypothetical protein